VCIRVNSWFENAASATNREWTLMDADKGDLIRVRSRQFVPKALTPEMNREWTLMDTNWKEPIRVHARLFVVEDAGSVIDHEWTPIDIN
jgi:hypothetical protein